jgi:hypothetical protein
LLVAFILPLIYFLKLKDYTMEKTAKTLLCETMFKMFKTDFLPNLDMEDFIVMWKALAEKWDCDITTDGWEEFTEEVNCVASNREKYFTEIFEKHFK